MLAGPRCNKRHHQPAPQQGGVGYAVLAGRMGTADRCVPIVIEGISGPVTVTGALAPTMLLYDQWMSGGGLSLGDVANQRVCRILIELSPEPLSAEVAAELETMENSWMTSSR